MFAFLGRLASRRPWFVIAAWVVLAIAVVSLAPALTTTQEESEFLPDHYESIKATKLQEEKFPGATTPAALIVFEREDGEALTEDDQAKVTSIAEELGPKLGDETFVQQVVTVSPDGKPNLSEDGLIQIGSSVSPRARPATTPRRSTTPRRCATTSPTSPTART